MEEEIIDLWYEEEKQKLSEGYIKSIEKGVPVDKRKKVFDKAMEKLNQKYNKKQQKLERNKRRKKRWKRHREKMAEPFQETYIAIAYSTKMLTGGALNIFTEGYHSLRFSTSLFWMKRGYKIRAGFQRRMRPFYYFYAKRMKYPLIILTKPLVVTWEYLSRKAGQGKASIKKSAKGIWKGTVKTSRYLWKELTAGYGKVSNFHEKLSKKYHAWYADRLQKSMDKKQAKKEAKEAKRKDKESKKDSKEAKKDVQEENGENEE